MKPCKGCLSVDRRLSAISEMDHKVFFSQLLEEKLSKKPLLLCWECLGHIRHAVKFKRRVQSANQIMKLTLDQSHKESLSQLRETAAICVNMPELDGQGLLTFVKSEEGADVIFDTNTDDFYLSDDYDDAGDVKEDVFTKIEEKSEPLRDIEVTVSPSERKRSASIDSDDVPLKLKSTKSKDLDKDTVREEKSSAKKRSPLSKRRKEKKAGVIENKRVIKKLEELNVDNSKIQKVVLSWEEVEAERQNALSSIVFTRHEYQCYDCVLGFNHKFKLDNHMKKHNESSGSSCCSTCTVRFQSAQSLAAHRRRHRVRWRCAACGETASRAAVAADHYVRHHGGGAATHTCTTCGHVAQSLSKLRIHLKNHKERVKCELCGKSFRDRTSLRTHLFIHKGEKEYSCPQCDKKFLFKKAMEIHLVTHEAPAGLYCHECDATFKNRLSYYQHMKYNLKHIDPAKLKYACELCEKKFVKAVRLEEHHMAVHLKVTPVQCTVPGCKFACSSRPVLRTHIRMLHRNYRVVRNHVCDTCGKAYTTKKTLEGHMRSHTGERPFQCKFCPSTFGYEAALYNHNKLVHLRSKRAKPPAPGPHQATSWGGFNLQVDQPELRASAT